MSLLKMEMCLLNFGSLNWDLGGWDEENKNF
jgi:hypothetical protein